MRVRISLVVTALPPLLAISLSAQHVVIKGATPSDVVKAVSNELSSQGFTLYDSTKSEAVFSLDRGVTTLNIRGNVSTITQVLELHLRFKQKSDGLEVNANEEMVGARGQHMVEFRNPVRSRGEQDNMQKLLDLIKSDLEARPVSP